MLGLSLDSHSVNGPSVICQKVPSLKENLSTSGYTVKKPVNMLKAESAMDWQSSTNFIRRHMPCFKGLNILYPHLNAAHSQVPLCCFYELTCLNFLQGKSLSWEESVIWFFLLFWHFFLLSCRSVEMPPLKERTRQWVMIKLSPFMETFFPLNYCSFSTYFFVELC